jgi:hypothetical protein
MLTPTLPDLTPTPTTGWWARLLNSLLHSFAAAAI